LIKNNLSAGGFIFAQKGLKSGFYESMVVSWFKQPPFSMGYSNASSRFNLFLGKPIPE
jgi:hypothetical protein